MKVIVYTNVCNKVELSNVTQYTVTNNSLIISFKDVESKEKAFKTFNKKFINKISGYAEGIQYYVKNSGNFTIDSKLYNIQKRHY